MPYDITTLYRAGLTQAELLEMRADLLDTTKTYGGSIINSTGTRDRNVSFTQIGSPEERLLAIRYALQRINSDMWGTDLIRRKKKLVR